MVRKQKTYAEQHAEKAAQTLAPKRAPSRAEQAALDYLSERRWILWHADDYVAGVVRLLSNAGLLRDTVREAELRQIDEGMRRAMGDAK